MLRSFAYLASAAFLAACAAGGEPNDGGSGSVGGGGEGGETGQLCVPGQQISCACPGGADGIQSCNGRGDGYGACNCGGDFGGGGAGEGGSDPCGDGTCTEGEENCHTCENDCGFCEPCTLAPSCDNAQIPPGTLMHVPTLDNVMMPMTKEQILARLEKRIEQGGPGVRLVAAALAGERAGELPAVSAIRRSFAHHPELATRVRGALTRARVERLDLSQPIDLANLGGGPITTHGGEFPGGTVECGAPLLRVRVSTVTVHEEDDDFANDIVYCALSSEAATASEIRVTPQTPNLDEGDSFTYAIEAGVFWGQAEPETPGGNLLLTYDCFETDSSDGYQSLIEGIGNLAEEVGGVAGSYGWIFGIIGAVAPVLSDALALDGDDHLFNAQQTIDLGIQLDMTNGRFWNVRRDGTHLNSDWDWELRVEAWGCAEYGTL
ncbi:MAG: hypothetical protein IPM79_34085 [Polyangiaceae bacterium]|jgi:hypothetical protein|nr:hypothetical protein [Polyangiaceae bacterium]MBK8942496.1 hypothetical protein [Polyangiaceae bacterium]